jgi:WD40 repeat protein
MRLHIQNNKTNSELWQKFTISLFIILTIIIFAYGQTTDHTKPELIAQTGHSSPVDSVTFSLDGKIIASGGSLNDYTIKLWSVLDGKELRTLAGHTDWVYL